ncbi:MAG: hydroxyacid dehydrogenase [Nitrospinota bacterium]
MPAKWKVLINEPWDTTLETHKALEEAGCELTLGVPNWETTRPCYDEDQLTEMARGADAIMGASRERYTRRLFDACPSLRILSKYGIGTEKIDVEAATEAGVLVGYTPVPENVESVCEYTLCLILNLVKKLDPSRRFMQEGGWRGAEWLPANLSALTVGIVGFGRIGRAVARKLVGWAGSVLVHDPWVQDEVFRAAGVESSHLEALLQRSDVVTLHVVVTPETRGLINERALRRMKPTAYLVNTSRGEAVDEEALVRALREGWIAGAALDVFRQEPPRMDHPLRSLSNAVLTPHFAWRTESSLRSMVWAATENLLAALRGEVPLYLKNPGALPHWRERFHLPG